MSKGPRIVDMSVNLVGRGDLRSTISARFAGTGRTVRADAIFGEVDAWSRLADPGASDLFARAQERLRLCPILPEASIIGFRGEACRPRQMCHRPNVSDLHPPLWLPQIATTRLANLLSTFVPSGLPWALSCRACLVSGFSDLLCQLEICALQIFARLRRTRSNFSLRSCGSLSWPAQRVIPLKYSVGLWLPWSLNSSMECSSREFVEMQRCSTAIS